MLLGLFYFFFLSLFISQSLMDISSALLTVAGLYYLYKNKPARLKIFNNYTFFWLWLVAWITELGLGYFYSPVSPIVEPLKYFSDIKYIFMGYVLYHVLVNLNLSDQIIRRINTFFILLCLIQIPMFFKSVETEPRLGGFMNNPMTLAHGYGIWVLFTFFFFIKNIKSDLKSRLLYLLSFSIGAFTLLLTLTRGVWLALAISLLLLTLFYSKRIFLACLGAGTTTLGLLMIFSQKFKDRLFYSLSPENYDQIRWNLWKTNWEIIKDHPLIGVGYGQNKELLQSYFDKLHITTNTMISHSHNQIIHWTAGTGFMGLLLIVGFWGYLLYKSIQTKNNDLIALTSSVLCFFFVGGLFEANFEHSKYKYMLMFAFAFIFSLQKNSESKHYA